MAQPDQLLANPYNWRIHTQLQERALVGSLDTIGWLRTVLVNRTTGHVIDGHLRVETAITNGEPVPVDYVDLTEDEERLALATLDPITSMAGRDVEKAVDLINAQPAPANQVLAAMFNSKLDIAAMIATDRSKRREIQGDADFAPAVGEDHETDIKWGDLFALGSHRLLCGDCTKPGNVERLLDGQRADCLFIDPPYCSGGFQEAGRAHGSIGTRGDERIANDMLSTRGYQNLMRAVFEVSRAGIAYTFTDWRMWTTLADVAEGSGYGIRNMIVWDKETPGMGQGWRSQHELIMCATKVTQPFDPKKAQGNVIRCSRTGNDLHPTQKPVELLERVLDVTDTAERVIDPMTGSGSTIIACERLGRICYAMELWPRFMAQTIARFEQLTGQRAELLSRA